MLVTKNGMVHKCNTEERYLSFIASGWEPYKIPKSETGKKKDNSKTKK